MNTVKYVIPVSAGLSRGSILMDGNDLYILTALKGDDDWVCVNLESGYPWDAPCKTITEATDGLVCLGPKTITIS